METLIQHRNADFKRRCLQIVKADYATGALRPLDSVLERAISQQPLSHYLNFDTASRRLHKIRRYGLETVVKEPLARRRWAELMAQVTEQMVRNKHMKFYQALTFVLNFKRPSQFYITPDTARRIISPYVAKQISLRQPV